MGERVAMISLHTSPLDQPGTGDAGGMNVYVIELSRRLAAQGIAVDVFTRATSSTLPQVVEAADGVLVRHIAAGPFEGLTKGELPGQLCTFAREVLRTEAAQPLGHYDSVHSHYWLSGQVGALARDRWNVPLVHSMHTMAKVKNASLAEGDTPEPASRVIGEEQVVEAADLLVANTDTEARQLVELYDASPDAVEVIHPGVDLDVFTPRDRGEARRHLDLPQDAAVLMFAGRIQPLKAPDVLLRAVHVLLEQDPGLRHRLVVPVVGGPSGEPVVCMSPANACIMASVYASSALWAESPNAVRSQTTGAAAMADTSGSRYVRSRSDEMMTASALLMIATSASTSRVSAKSTCSASLPAQSSAR